MPKGGYLRDRGLLIGASLVALGVVVVALSLDNAQRGQDFGRGIIGYALGLALLVLLLALLMDWLRQMPWQQELQVLLTKPMEDLSL